MEEEQTHKCGRYWHLIRDRASAATAAEQRTPETLSTVSALFTFLVLTTVTHACADTGI